MAATESAGADTVVTPVTFLGVTGTVPTRRPATPGITARAKDKTEVEGIGVNDALQAYTLQQQAQQVVRIALPENTAKEALPVVPRALPENTIQSTVWG